MKKIITILALFAVLTTGAVSAETVDCFYEFNASNPACQK